MFLFDSSSSNFYFLYILLGTTGSTTTVTCDTGFSLQPSINIDGSLTYVATCSTNGRFNSERHAEIKQPITCDVETCTATQVPNSDKSASGAITGTTGSTTTVTCDTGYREIGTKLTASCGAGGTFYSITCAAQACTATQIPNSDKSASGAITGTTGSTTTVTCDTGYRELGTNLIATCGTGGTFNSDSITCASKNVCLWSDISGNDIDKGTYSVPAPGCKMKKHIKVKVDVTIEGVSGSYRELQSNRVGDRNVAASYTHRHFDLELPGKLTLNYLKLTWGQTGSTDKGGFIRISSGTLAINWVHFDGTKTSGTHAYDGGCIYVEDGEVTIKKSTFEGCRAKTFGGALCVYKTSTAMTIESTTFKNNEAGVRVNILWHSLNLYFRLI